MPSSNRIFGAPCAGQRPARGPAARVTLRGLTIHMTTASKRRSRPDGWSDGGSRPTPLSRWSGVRSAGRRVAGQTRWTPGKPRASDSTRAMRRKRRPVTTSGRMKIT